jgi:hypothetical protein
VGLLEKTSRVRDRRRGTTKLVQCFTLELDPIRWDRGKAASLAFRLEGKPTVGPFPAERDSVLPAPASLYWWLGVGVAVVSALNILWLDGPYVPNPTRRIDERAV